MQFQKSDEISFRKQSELNSKKKATNSIEDIARQFIKNLKFPKRATQDFYVCKHLSINKEWAIMAK